MRHDVMIISSSVSFRTSTQHSSSGAFQNPGVEECLPGLSQRESYYESPRGRRRHFTPGGSLCEVRLWARSSFVDTWVLGHWRILLTWALSVFAPMRLVRREDSQPETSGEGCHVSISLPSRASQGHRKVRCSYVRTIDNLTI